MKLVERSAPCWLLALGRFALVLGMLTPGAAIAQAPIASSDFSGSEDPLSEDGAWVALRAMASQGTQFQKNFGAYPNSSKGDRAGNPHHGGHPGRPLL